MVSDWWPKIAMDQLYLLGQYLFLKKGDPAVMEAKAISMALMKAMGENWTSIVIISDCKALIQKINMGSNDLSSIGILVSDIRLFSKSFWRYFFSFVHRRQQM